MDKFQVWWQLKLIDIKIGLSFCIVFALIALIVFVSTKAIKKFRGRKK